MCPHCLVQYKSGVDYCTKCGRLKVDYRYCGNPKCKVYEKPCEVDNIFCGKCGELTLFKYHGEPPAPPKPDPPILTSVWMILFLIIFIMMLVAVNTPR